MSRSDGKIARRYAEALFGLYSDADLGAVAAALEEFAGLLRSNTELAAALANPGVIMQEREAVLRDLSERVRPGDLHLANFCALLLMNSRLSALPGIAEVFKRLVEQKRRLLALEITSAFPLDSEEQAALQAKVKAEHGTLVSIDWRVDPEILGGLIVKAGDRLLDSSVRGSLEQIGSELAR